jgi:catalase
VAHSDWVGKVRAYSSDVEDIDWEQPRILWELFKKNGEDEVFIHNLSGHVNKALPEVQKDTISKFPSTGGLLGGFFCARDANARRRTEMFAKVDEDIGKRLEEALNKLGENVDHKKAPPSQRVMATHRR